ncbi:MAG: Arginine deiminase [Phycisphaerae bacterium]|nr:Arginine deiminase [Phycisphaerae bacterium]
MTPTPPTATTRPRFTSIRSRTTILVMELCVGNEYHPLEAVLVHRPGPEIDRLNFHNMRRFLFEDIPYLRRMQDEHDEFTQRMRDHGVQVLYLEELLRELLNQDTAARDALIQEICTTEQTPALSELLLSGRFNSRELLDILFAGMTSREYHHLTGQNLAAAPLGDFVLPPIPNAYFSRDPAVVVKNAAISCKMHYGERVRETILTRTLLEWHPWFENRQIIYGGSDSPEEDRPHTVEGGDVLVLNDEAVIIGVSERTRWQAIEKIAHNVFDIGHIRRMYEVTIPAERDYMHLDTVFTIIDRGVVCWYPPVMEQVREIQRFEPLEYQGRIIAQRVSEVRTLTQILCDEFGCPVTIIHTAGGDPHYAPREQRTDGTNVLAIAPRRVIMYDRNFKTQEELQRHGVETICINGSELVRGLGGPRCMSMPLRRAVAC